MPLSSELSKGVLYLKLPHPLIKIGLEMFNSLTPLTFPFFHCVFHECPYPQNYQGLFLYLMFPHTLIKTGLEMGVVF